MLRNTVQTEEGVRLCETCFKEICLEPNFTCPGCGISVNPTQLTVTHLEEHNQGCRYRPVRCPNHTYGCSELLAPDEDKRVDQECQYRRVRCSHCQLECCAVGLEEHLTTCPKYPVVCDPNPGCGDLLPPQCHSSQASAYCGDAVVMTCTSESPTSNLEALLPPKASVQDDQPPQFHVFQGYCGPGASVVMACGDRSKSESPTSNLEAPVQDDQGQWAEETAAHDLLETAVECTQAGSMVENASDDTQLQSQPNNKSTGRFSKQITEPG